MLHEANIKLYNAGYKLYESLVENILLNKGNYIEGKPFLGAIRNDKIDINAFNDIFYLIYHDELNQPQVFVFRGTTHPGKYYTDKPMNKYGAAILEPGMYNDIWILGQRKSFKKFYKNGIVFRQNGSKVKIRYDANKNGIADDFEILGEGNFEIQFHLGNLTNLVRMIGKWGAGCQLAAFIRDYDFVIRTQQRYDELTRKENRISYYLTDMDNMLMPTQQLIQIIAA